MSSGRIDPPGHGLVNEAHGWYAVGLLSLATMVGYIDRSLLSLLVAPIRGDLGLSGTEMSLLLGFAFAVFMGVASLPIAWLADRYDRSRLLAAGILGWSLMTGLGAFADDYWTLFISRVGVGIGEACLIPAGAALIADLFRREKLGRANAVITLGAAFGAGFALILGGSVVHWAMSDAVRESAWLQGFRGWQAALLLAALPGVPLALVFLLTVRDPRSAKRVVATSTVPPSATVSWLDFVKEHRRTLTTLWLAYPLAAGASQGWLAWSPTQLMQRFALDPATAGLYFGGLLLTFGAGGTILGGIATDSLFRRGKADAALRLSIGACLILAVCGALAPFTTSLVSALLLLGVYFFFASVMAVMPTLAMQLITPPALRARMIAGLLLVATVVGGGFGPTLVAIISERLFGSMASLGNALALTALTLCPITALVLQLARAPFARSLASTRAPA